MLSEKQLRSVERSKLLELTSDVTLILDGDGIVLEAAIRMRSGNGTFKKDWSGKALADLVTPESREKVAELLRDAGDPNIEEPRWRQLNHPGPHEGIDHPVRYCALKLGKGDRILGLGHDMMPLAEVQQQLIDAQEAAEQDYWRLRQSEARFRVLFEAAAEAILVVDAESGRILEANPSAQRILPAYSPGERRLLSAHFAEDADSIVRQLLLQARISGHANASDVPLRADGAQVEFNASLLRQGNTASIIVRLMPVGERAAAPEDPAAQSALKLLKDIPDAVVIADGAGTIVFANDGFADLAQLANVEYALGANLATWVGRTDVDLGVLTANLRKSGSVRAFQTQLRGAQGVTAQVEASATLLEQPNSVTLFGLILRDVSQRVQAAGSEPVAARTGEELAKLVGRVPLKDLVRESTDHIERLSIDAALQLTGGNRAAAAEMLGLSRQSLYFKMRRFGVGEDEKHPPDDTQ